jgi:hypothetical protein
MRSWHSPARVSVASGARTLSWEGCCDIRDLGGLPTEDGSETRFGVVVRADDEWLGRIRNRVRGA